MASVDDTRSRMQQGPAAPRPLGTAYLLVVMNNSSSVRHLPASGSMVLGRSSDVDVPLDHGSVTRRHAAIEIDNGVMRIADLGSRNGTKVNGELITGFRTLSSGDVIGAGDVTLVVHVSNPPIVSRSTYAEAGWKRRLAEELERAVTYHRPLSVLAISGVASSTVAEVGESLRLIDVVGDAADGSVLVLMPESDSEQASVTASRMLSALRGAAPDVRCGIASCPTDATDVDSILVAVRKALRHAGPGAFVEACAAATELKLGGRSVMVLDPAMSRVFNLIERVAPSMLPVLINGETGVGKENAAYAVHHWSGRTGPFVPVNCSTINESLADAQLFGSEKGAFTGAVSARVGLFESAHGGTLFLDEIGDLSPPIQLKLLRALQEKKIMRVGDTREREVDVRIVSATLKNLEEEALAGRFREDLWGRIHGARVILPPLRDRRCEIPMLARRFLDEFSAPAKEISAAAMQALLAYHWPRNVRELRMAMEYANALAPDHRIEPSDLPPEILGATTPSITPVSAERAAVNVDNVPASFRPVSEEVEELERTRMVQALIAAEGVKTRAAQLIGMPIRTFTHKLRHYKL